jgi:predicted kinase
MAKPNEIKPLVQGHPPAPLLVCIGGLPGTGKTTAGLALLGHMAPDTVFVCPDRTMLRLLGKPEGSAIESSDITPALHAAAVADMKDRTRQALTSGHCVVVPSAFVGEAMRQAFEAIAAETGADFRPFWLEAPIPVLHNRAIRRQDAAKDPKSAFNASAVGTDKICPDLVEGTVTWPRIDAGQSPADVLNAILEKLALPNRPGAPEPNVIPS